MMQCHKKDVIPSKITELRLKNLSCIWIPACPSGLLPLVEGAGMTFEIVRKNGAETQICTGDARIFSPALYYLSYLGVNSW